MTGDWTPILTIMTEKPGKILRTLLLATILATFSLPSEAAPPDVAPAGSQPSALSDLMIRLQFQHIKLWFAGRLNNWSLATYEAQQIDASLKNTSKPSPGGADANRAIEKLQVVREAIQSMDVSAFTKAYSALTNECNGCHRANGYASITIQVPVNSPFPDQLFTDQLADGRALANASCGGCHVISDGAKDTPASGFPAPRFVEISKRASFSADGLRQYLMSGHRRLGPDQAMPNPRLADYQIEAIVAYFEALRAGGSR
ncbi:cytochrome c [Bradyrhizobium sp. 41S5]|uniref:c-type cytochrome n=1 Tax=Bradyrhizobium sp. 41S5 TaxID=1404443 RepID=UPI001E3E95C9|nr:c-type cytochrome [Bradyrhizobium sp. 41S5]UFX44462.1 cytochrome c [Bradyrhizobium sp. 41S5]